MLQLSKRFVDIYITSYRRSDLLAKCLDALFVAIHHSPFNHRVIVLSDHSDEGTIEVLRPLLGKIHFVTTPEQLGLPFTFNLLLDYSKNLISRSGEKPKFICYLQDDAVIAYPHVFFKTIDQLSNAVSPAELGFLSGFYTPIHPGFEKIKVKGVTIVKSDSVDGKNLIGKPELFESIGPISKRIKGMRRGNPGPLIGSGFDLWQWRDSPNSTTRQNRINLIIPGLVRHIGDDGSTWGNDSDQDERIARRIKRGNFYNTRKQYPTISEKEYFQP